MGIGKTNFPDYSDKAVCGYNRVGSFNAVNASFINGKRIEAVRGISAYDRCRFKFIVGVSFLKSEEGTELFVFAFFLFVVDKFFVCKAKLLFKFLNTEIVFFRICKTVKKSAYGFRDSGTYFKKRLGNYRSRLGKKNFCASGSSGADHYCHRENCKSAKNFKIPAFEKFLHWCAAPPFVKIKIMEDPF